MAKKDTTPKGVSRRDEYEDQIVERRHQEMIDREGVEAESLVSDNTPEPEEKPKEELEESAEEGEKSENEEAKAEEKEDEEQQEEIKEEQESPVFLQDGVWMTRAKINGEEHVVPYEKTLASYQKGETADARLREAAERRKELEAWQTELQQKEQALRTTQPSRDAGAAPSEDVQTERVALITRYHEALTSGDDEEAADLLSQIAQGNQGGPQPTQVDPKAIIEQAKQEIREDEKREKLLKARKRFMKEFEDLAGDTYLFEVANKRSAELYDEDPDRDPWEILQEAGTFTRERFKEPAKTPVKSDQSRKARKENLASDEPATASAAPGSDEPAPQTYSDIIAEEKAARGQRF